MSFQNRSLVRGSVPAPRPSGRPSPSKIVPDDFVTRAGVSFLFAAMALGTGVTAAAAPGVGAQTASPQPFTIEDLVQVKRLSDPQVSPDGRYVAYVLRETDM